MIDNLALAISHGLMLLAAWMLLKRPDLDDDDASPPGSQEKSDPVTEPRPSKKKDRKGA